MNRQLRMYHSGATDDLATVIDQFLPVYDEVALVGFSLGGNLVLKYLGEQGASSYSQIRAAVTISVPTNLEAGSLNIGKRSNFIYERKFLTSLFEKVSQKQNQYPDTEIFDDYKSIKTLYEFDDQITGPLHGYSDAKDYYTQCSSEHFIEKIKVPSLIINALDDPFLPEECYPHDRVEKNDLVEMVTPEHGGHVGFVQREKKYYWAEEMIAHFLNKKSETVT